MGLNWVKAWKWKTKKNRRHQKGRKNIVELGVNRLRKQNLWYTNPYVEKMLPLPEHLRVNRSDLTILECKKQFKIEEIPDLINGTDLNNEMFRLFAKLVSNNVKFMKQWVRYFALTNQGYLQNVASDYLSSKGMTLREWITGKQRGQCVQCLCDECNNRYVCFCSPDK